MKKTSEPPGFAVWLLSKRLPTEWRDFVIGDLEEEFASRSGASPIAARAWFWWQTIRCLAAPPRARPDPTKSRGRENLSFLPLDAFVRDVRYAFRTMRRQKTFTALAVLCLALGIGANTTIFSFMDSILFRALPVEKPDELVILQWTANRPDGRRAVGDAERAAVWLPSTRACAATAGRIPCSSCSRSASELFTEVFGSQPVSQLRVDDGDGPTADGLYVTGNFFRSLGVGARAGRLLADDDDRFDAPPAVVLSSAFGTERFGSAEAAVGRSIRINGVAFTVVGVAPPSFFGLDPERRPSFYLPMRSGPLLVAASPRLALPGGEGPAAATLVGNTLVMYENPRFNWVSAWARLRPGVSREQVEATLRPQFDQFFAANVAEPRFVAQCTAAGGCGGNGRSRRHAQKLRRNSARAVRDGRGDSRPSPARASRACCSNARPRGGEKWPCA